MKDMFETDEFIFYYTNLELSYIEKSIQLIDDKLSSGIIELEEEFDKELMAQHKEMGVSVPFEEYKRTINCEWHNTDNIKSTINESILIKIYTIFEKAIIRFSYEMQKYYDCKIPPNFNVKGNYSNILSAVEYIKLLSGFDISKIVYWEHIEKLKNIRNRLSHGNTTLKIDSKEVCAINHLFFTKYNKEKVSLLEEIESEGTENLVRITNNTTILYTIRKIIVMTIRIVDENYFYMRVRDDKEKLNPYLYDEHADEEYQKIIQKIKNTL